MAKYHEAADETLRTALCSDAQTIFDMEMKAIQNFEIYIPTRDGMPQNPAQAIPETVAKNNPPPPTKRHIQENPQDENTRLN
jgi:hypothetical protein